MACGLANGSTNAFHQDVRYKKPESTDIKVTAGLGKRLLIFMALVLLLLGGGAWLKD